MKTFKEFIAEAKKQKKPNPYAVDRAEKSKFRYIKYKPSLTVQVGDWETVKTEHGDERGRERSTGELPGGHVDFMKKVIKDIEKRKTPKNGEYYYRSVKYDQGAFLYIHNDPKQIRVLSIMPKGNHLLTKAGDREIQIEGIEENNIETVVLYDTEFDEMFDQFIDEQTE